MKITVIITLLIAVSHCLVAQESDTLDTKQKEEPIVIIEDNDDGVSVGIDEIIKFDESGDTTKITIGDKDISIVDGEEGTSLKVTDSDDKDKEE